MNVLVARTDNVIANRLDITKAFLACSTGSTGFTYPVFLTASKHRNIERLVLHSRPCNYLTVDCVAIAGNIGDRVKSLAQGPL
ncbi:hypothetical protein D3C85_1255020 [compost metagenome]